LNRFNDLKREDEMKRVLTFLVLLSAIGSVGNAWAAYESDSLIYTGPPEYEEVYLYGNGPTYVSGDIYNRDAEAQADWWSLGGRFQKTWDSSSQGWLYVFSDFYKDFMVTSAGQASISFSLDGLLNVDGNTDYNGKYDFYTYAYVEDSSLGINPDIEWYFTLDSVGSAVISENATFNFIFDENDIGDMFTISMAFESMVSLPIGVNKLAIADGDSLVFNSDFLNGFKIGRAHV
jgi:hypothetical protein